MVTGRSASIGEAGTGVRRGWGRELESGTAVLDRAPAEVVWLVTTEEDTPLPLPVYRRLAAELARFSPVPRVRLQWRGRQREVVTSVADAVEEAGLPLVLEPLQLDWRVGERDLLRRGRTVRLPLRQAEEVRLLAQQGIKVEAWITAEEDLEAGVRRAWEAGVARLVVRGLLGTVMTAHRLEEFLADLVRAMAGLGRLVHLSPEELPQVRRVLRQKDLPWLERDAGHGPWTFGVKEGVGSIYLDPRGRCFAGRHLPFPVGLATRESVVHLYRRSPVLLALRQPGNLQGKCRVCPYREVCGGSRARAFAQTFNAFAPDPLCPFQPPRQVKEA